MSERTPRDVAWAAILNHLQEHDYVRTSDLDFDDEINRRTARRVLRSMEELELVYRESPSAKTWYPTHRLAGIVSA